MSTLGSLIMNNDLAVNHNHIKHASLSAIRLRKVSQDADIARLVSSHRHPTNLRTTRDLLSLAALLTATWLYIVADICLCIVIAH